MKLRAEFNDAYPKRDKSSDGWVGDSAHSSRSSDHNPDSRGIVHAIDVDKDLFPGSDVEFDALIEKVSNDPRIKYTIWRKRIKYPGKPWKPYSGANPHDKHAHFSATVAGENDARSWGISKAAPKKEESLNMVLLRNKDNGEIFMSDGLKRRHITPAEDLMWKSAGVKTVEPSDPKSIYLIPEWK